MGRELPWKLTVVLGLLALISILAFLFALTQSMPELLVAVVLNIVLMVGLYLGHRWAFVVALVFCVIGLVVGLAQKRNDGRIVGITHVVIAGGLFGSRKYFWGSLEERRAIHPLRCPECSYSLLGLTQPRCPECGLKLDEFGHRQTNASANTRRTAPWLIGGLIALMAVACGGLLVGMQYTRRAAMRDKARQIAADGAAQIQAEAAMLRARMKAHAAEAAATTAPSKTATSSPP